MRIFRSARVFTLLAASVLLQVASAQTPPTTGSDGKQASGSVSRGGKITIQYGDPQFDQKLATGKSDEVEIVGIPQGVHFFAHFDRKGLYFWFDDATAKRVNHYVPDSLKSIRAGGGIKVVDDLRVQAVESILSENNAKGFKALEEKTNVVVFMGELSAIGYPKLDFALQVIHKAAANSPDNPYLQICESALLGMQAFKPLVAEMNAEKPVINLNNPQTIAQLNEALQLADKAGKTAKRAEETERLAKEVARRTGKRFEPIDVVGDYSPYDHLGSATRQVANLQVCLTGLRASLPLVSPLKRRPSEPAPPKKAP